MSLSALFLYKGCSFLLETVRACHAAHFRFAATLSAISASLLSAVAFSFDLTISHPIQDDCVITVNCTLTDLPDEGARVRTGIQFYHNSILHFYQAEPGDSSLIDQGSRVYLNYSIAYSSEGAGAVIQQDMSIYRADCLPGYDIDFASLSGLCEVFSPADIVRFAKDITFKSEISEAECAISSTNPTVYQISWKDSACPAGRTIVTLENQRGKSIQQTVPQDINHISITDDISLEGDVWVNIYPEDNLGGMVGQQVNCPGPVIPSEPPVRATSRVIITGNINIRSDGYHSSLIPAPLSNIISFTAYAGTRLHLAFRLLNTNDYFIGFDQEGLPLYQNGNDGKAIYASNDFQDITDQLRLFDAGTEIDQKPGMGLDQLLTFQGAPDPHNMVRYASNPYGNLPPLNQIVKLEISASLKNSRPVNYTLRITNLGAVLSPNPGCTTLKMAFSHCLYLLSYGNNPFYTIGLPDDGQGLAELAEDTITYLLQASTADLVRSKAAELQMLSVLVFWLTVGLSLISL